MASTPADMSAPVAPPPYSHLSISPAGSTGDELAVLAPKFEPGATEPVMVPSAMTISNKSEENVLFKIKINFGKEYCTLKPCFGRLLPGKAEEVFITLKVLPILPLTDLDWCIKVYDTVDHISTPEYVHDQPNLKATWSKIDDRMPNVFKRLIPIRFVGAAPADSESEKSVPLAGMMTSPRCDRVAAALRSFPSPPAPPPTPVSMERPKSPSLDQKVRMRSFARETARTENICEPSASEPTFIEELKASIRDLNHCAA